MAHLTRRTLIEATAGIAAAALAPRIVLAQTTPPAAGPFRQDPLPYATNALEPSIDARTMEIHYGKHHAAYVANLNAVAKDNPQIAQMPAEQVLAKLGDLPDTIRTAVRNNLGGHANHSMFWQIMGPPGHRPESEVAAAIDRDLGGLDKFRADFDAAGLRVFGLGLGLPHRGPRRQARDRNPPEPGFAADGRQARIVRQRRVGARLLPAISKSPGRLPQGLVEHGELAQGRRTLCRRQGRDARLQFLYNATHTTPGAGIPGNYALDCSWAGAPDWAPVTWPPAASRARDRFAQLSRRYPRAGWTEYGTSAEERRNWLITGGNL
jgi:hypothetical protein